MKTFFIAIVIALSLGSCASYNGRMVKQAQGNLEKTSLNTLDGTYSLYSFKGYKRNGDTYPDDHDSNVSSLYRYIGSDNFETDSLAHYTVTVKAENANTLKFEFKKDDLTVKSHTIEGKLKSNGLFYLGNQIKDCTGVPYILGGCYHSKTRIGRTKNGDLLVQNAVDSSGAILILFSGGYSYNSAYAFQRI